MSEKRPVVMGIDGSRSSRGAALWAADEARRQGLGLLLVHAVSLGGYVYAGGYVPPQGFFDGLRAEAGRELQLACDEVVGAYPGLEVRSRISDGHPVPALVEESRRASLVVLGSHRDEPGGGVLSSSAVAVSVVAHGHSPVAVVHLDHRTDASSVGGPVVVGIDGSPASERAIAIAFDEASRRRTGLVAVHAWNDYASETEFLYASQFVVDWGPIHAGEQEIMAERLAGWQEKYPDVTINRVITRARPERCLIEQAASAQLLVVGSRGRGGFSGMLLGSTSRKLINNSPCPLIVARP